MIFFRTCPNFFELNRAQSITLKTYNFQDSIMIETFSINLTQFEKT